MSTQVFFVGTGRCGTLTMAQLFSEMEGCRVAHQLEPWLVQESADYRSGRMSRPEMIDLLRRTRSPEALGGERISGEANLMLSLLLPEMAEAFPNAKYVWLIRDGRDMVNSALERHWYHKATPRRNHAWAIMTPRADEFGEMSTTEWENLCPFGRTTWFWSYVNRRIERDRKELKLDMLYVKLEEMKRRTGDIMQFIGLEAPPDAQAPHAHPSHVRNRKRVTWKDWSPGQRKIFTELAGGVMDQYYGNWRESMRFTTGQEFSALLNRSWIGFYDLCADVTRPVRQSLKKWREPAQRRTA